MLLIAYRRLWGAKRTAKDMPRYIFALDTMDARASGVKFAFETSALRDAAMVADVRVTSPSAWRKTQCTENSQ